MADQVNFENFDEGDKILFNDRKTPLTVKNISEKNLIIEGPSGGEYKIYKGEEELLVCRKGNERYSSYCKDLRKTGKWVRKGDSWKHNVSNAEITVEEKDNGFWTISSDKLSGEIDVPLYGFTSKEDAVEEIESFTSSHPEG